MSVQYTAIGWNPQKKIYDKVLAGGILAYLTVFAILGTILHPNTTAETLLIRGSGTLGLLLLQIILCIGPLARMDSRFLPLLYNRRHLGVAMFMVALVHGVFSLIQFHAFGDVNPLVSLFVSNTRFGSAADFPFQSLGFFALIILFIMAATSHDFWLHNLSPVVWKRLHMSVYAAYLLLIAHVVLGALQSETSILWVGMLGLGMLIVCGLHLASGYKEHRKDQAEHVVKQLFDACSFEDVREGHGCSIAAGEERIAVFRHEGRPYAMSNVCRHQGGPLGEGRIVDGCVTCPWHGYQYRPETGISPPPYDDKIPVYPSTIVDGRVMVDLGKR
jgi:methionine sulfoxide reductase heme-binding subunit